MRHEKAGQVLELARLLASTAEGLTLDEMAERMAVSRRTVERMRDAVRDVFPQLEDVVDWPTTRYRIPAGLDHLFQTPTAEELAALAASAEMMDRQGASERARAQLQGPMNSVSGESAATLLAMEHSVIITTRFGRRGVRCVGQLTATLQIDAADEADAAQLIPALTQRAGRILANGWPTGVEVCHAMVHGGPYPATSDGRTTSVGSLAIYRFLRPVSFQNLPHALLPVAVRDGNPWDIARRIDGVREASPRRRSRRLPSAAASDALRTRVMTNAGAKLFDERRSPSPRIHGTIAHDIGVEIVSGVRKPGDVFGGEIEASEALGVSRTAYREAIRILAAKGLIESRPKAGTRVTQRSRWNLLDPDVLGWAFEGEPDTDFILDLFELRSVIEPAAAAFAARRRSDDDLATIAT
eukprot:gene37515-50643_t